MAEDFPKLMMDIRPPPQEVQRTTSRMNTNKTKRKNLHLGPSHTNRRKPKIERKT